MINFPEAQCLLTLQEYFYDPLEAASPYVHPYLRLPEQAQYYLQEKYGKMAPTQVSSSLIL